MGPVSTIVIAIDPETLREIFKYAAGLITIYGAQDYIGEFAKAFWSKLGEKAAEGLAAGLAKF